MSVFSERLRELRKQAGLTQDDVAGRVHLDKQTISQYELGKREPDFEKLERLCDFFNVSTDYLLGKSDVTVRLLTSDELTLLNQKNPGRSIPALKNIASGVSIESISNIEDYVLIPDSWPGEYGALIVKDDSMSPLIQNGDTVIFRKQPNVSSGDIVIAIISDTETTVKKLLKKRGNISLLPMNPEYDPIEFSNKESKDRLKVLGIVVESRHRFA